MSLLAVQSVVSLLIIMHFLCEQIILHNTQKKHNASEKRSTRHSPDREPPLPVYIGLNIHSLIRSKQLIEKLDSLGISISYDRVMELEKNIALTMCEQYRANGIVCPSHLRK